MVLYDCLFVNGEVLFYILFLGNIFDFILMREELSFLALERIAAFVSICWLVCCMARGCSINIQTQLSILEKTLSCAWKTDIVLSTEICWWVRVRHRVGQKSGIPEWVTDSPPIGLWVTRGVLQVQRLQQLQITVNTTTTTLDCGSPDWDSHNHSCSTLPPLLLSASSPSGHLSIARLRGWLALWVMVIDQILAALRRKSPGPWRRPCTLVAGPLRLW